MKKQILSLVALSLFLFSCSKDEQEPESEPLFEIPAGNDQLNIDDFSIKLNAQLDASQMGGWTILSGLIDEKVFFDKVDEPQTVFHGLPGEEYQLEWRVTSGGMVSRDTITISFEPLKTEITDKSLDFYTTRKHLEAIEYDGGIWKIEGDDYRWIWNQNFGGTVIPDEESNHIKFFGYENKSYKIIWETWYGSISATDTLYFDSKEYHQYEALESLNILGNEYYYKLDDNGNVVQLLLGGDMEGTKFDRIDSYPSLRSLVHLKRLDLSGDGLHESPEVITNNYLKLEYLDLGANHFERIPGNIGNLKKLDTLILDHMQGGHKMKMLPESFGQLESLKFLELGSMGLESLPESFSELTNLEFLDLEGNHIASLPTEFGNLKKLKRFRGPAIYTNLPESFSELESLEFAFFYLQNSNPRLPENFGDLDNLETLWVFSDIHQLPDSFTDLEKIKDLEFTGATELLHNLPKDIGKLNTLENLRIHGSFKTLPESIGNLKKLKFLHISGTLENLPASIVDLEQLEYLNLYAMNVKALPEDINKLKNLKTIRLGNNKVEAIPENLGYMESLTELDLSYNRLSSFPTSLSNLKDVLTKFYIRGNNYSSEELQKLKEMLPNTYFYYD